MTGTKKEIMNWLIDQKEEKFEIQIHKEKRSINANSYAWVLMQKIADKLGTNKIEIYRKYIKEKGIFRPITVNNEAVNTICHSWENQGIGWLYEVVNKGNTTTDLLLYYGSSSYNKNQMNNFLDYIIEDCKLQNIETLTPKEIEKMKVEWKNEK